MRGLLILALCAPLFAQAKPPLPDPNESVGWVWASTLDQLNALPEDTPHLHLRDVTDAMLTALKRLSALQSLTLRGTYTNAGIAGLQHLKQLRDLQLDCAKLTPAVLATIGRLHELEWLGFEQCKSWDNTGLAQLAELKKVTWLIIHGAVFGNGMPQRNSGITDAGLKSLAAMKDLEHLDISDCTGIKGRGVAELLPKLKKLKWLDLVSCAGDGALAGVARHPALEMLHLNNVGALSARGLEALTSAKALREIRLGQVTLDDAGVAVLAKCAALEKVSFSGALTFGDKGVAALAGLRSLISISLDLWAMPTMPGSEPAKQAITDESLKALGKCKKLETLHLGGIDGVTNRGLEYLIALELKSLGLVACPGISDAGMAVVGKIASLRKLNLATSGMAPPGAQAEPGPRLTDRGVAALKDLPNLAELNLSGQRSLTDKSLEAISALTTLTVLYMTMVRYDMNGKPSPPVKAIGDKGLAALARLVNLTDVDLSGTGISDAGLPQLTPLKALRALTIQECPGVTRTGAAALQAELPGCSIAWETPQFPG